MFTATGPFFVFFTVTDFIFERLRTYAGCVCEGKIDGSEEPARHLISRGSLDSIKRLHFVATARRL
jgi:hypothetical protein